MNKFLAVLVLGLIATFNVSAQKGKDGSYTVTAAGDILNSYTSLTASATTGSTSITVASNTMNSGFFTGNLAAGDLIFIIQTKGVSMRGLGQDVGNVDGIAGNDTVGFPPDFDMGRILDYHNCGNYEFAEVVSTSGGSIINLRCALENDYTVPAVLHTGGSSNNTAAVAGTVQIIRVPRFTDLTVNLGASITAPAWNGTFGGAVILEVETNTTINGAIDVDAIGFRGGDDVNASTNFGGATASTMPREGGRKGEGIGGYMGSYSWWGGMYGRGAMANAGGGGTAHNAGGGGGANAASIAWSEGRGNPDLAGGAGWITAWNLETPVSGLSSATTSGGGGRGGYSFSQDDEDATMVPPNDANWGGDNRRVVGGLGGRPLDYSTGKLFFGGGGGAGDMNDSEGGFGGNAAGLVFIKSYGDVAGSGSIEANGQDGFDAIGPAPGFGQMTGNDAAGGGGAGGTVVIEARNNINGITINANGGDGGDQVLQVGPFGPSETEGPGGGAGGGYVRQTVSTATVNFSGGANGITTSPEMTEFTPNGATMGSAGDSDATTSFGFTVEDDTICGGGTATLTIATYGTIPGGTTTIWYSDLGSTIVGTGNSFTTPVLASNTTYYVGMCPGANLCEVNVVVSPAIIVDQTGLLTTNENCGNADGSITGITATGGTGVLSYDWNGNSTLGADTVGVAAGSYTLTVTDANGCSETAGPFSITNSGGPTIDASGISIVDEACGNGAGSITGITASGTGTLTYDWNGNSTLGADTLNLAAGSYTLTVTDGNGCSATSGPHTVNNLGAPTIDISNMVITNETCTAGNGSITGIIVTGASSPVYDWNSTITPTPDLNGVGAGSYTFTVTDGACTASVGPFSITDSPDPVIDVSGMTITDENCGQGDGSITGITVTGTPTITYTWNGSASATPDLTNQTTGNYTLIATDGNGCTATVGPFNIGSYAGPVIDISGLTITDETCLGNDGSITGISVTGTATIIYDWSGNITPTADLTGQAGGTFTLLVTDGVGCTASSGPHTINTISGPVIDASNIVITDENCGNGAGSITGITATGSGTLIYDWNGNTTLGADTLNLAGGSYTLTVTDGNGCTATSGPHTVNNNGAPTIDISNMVITNETCSAGNGSITGIIVTGATSPVYDWNSTVTPTTDLNGVGAGSYTFTVTDGACTASVGPFAITDSPAPVIDVTGMTITDENCGQGDGSITGITVTGTPTITYTWNGSASATPDLTNQTTGNYTLIATDGNGCTATVGPFNIGSYAGPVIDISGLTITDETCLGNDGSITGISVTGTATIIYDWSGNITPTADLTGQAGGTFTLLVTDGVGCTASSGPHTINTISGPVIDASNIVITDENCGNGAGSITGITATGSGTLIYDWNGNTTLGADTLNLAGGSYTLTVTDGNGCTATSGPHTVNNNGAPTIDITNMVITNETCSAGNGSITGIIVTGATSPVYDWNSTVTPTTDLNGVGAGSYTFTVTDGACTASVGPFAITDSPAPVIDVTGMTITDENCGQGDGSITGITVTGTPTITYTWNGNASATPDLSGQSSGSYTLIATDGNGCTSSAGPFNIGSYTGPTIDVTGMVITDESCFGNDGSITGIIVTGNGTITYDWSGNITPTADLNGQTGGSYTLTVTDGVGCTASSGPHTIITTTGPIIDVTNMVISDENCGNVDGSITGIVVTGGSGTLSYDWSGNSTANADLNNQSAGSYTLTVTDAAGCTSSTGPHTINGTAPVVVGFSGNTTICEGQSTTLTANGGTTYQWTPGGTGTSISVTPTVTTNYELIGTTGPCADTLNFTVTVNPLPQTAVTGDTVMCEGESTTLTSSGSFNFEWDNGNLTNQITVSPSITTTYQVIASNSCGDDTVTTVVTVNPLPTADAGLDQTILVGGSANLNGSGGTMYSWTPPDGLDCTNCEDPVASPLTTTTYYVTVTDGNGCSRIDSVTITVDETSVLFIPNIFSPNGDGLNDVLEVKGGGIETFVFRIFDRWGEKVFETSDLNVGWDGTFRGQNAVQGVYIYGISGNYYDGTKIDQSGNITLVR